MQCPKCKEEISDNSKFCFNCGTNIKEYLAKLEEEKYIICPNCDKKIEKDSKFCKYCGIAIKDFIKNAPQQFMQEIKLHITIAFSLLIVAIVVSIFIISEQRRINPNLFRNIPSTPPKATIEVINSRLFNMGYGTQKIEGVVKNNSYTTCFNPNVEIYTFNSAGNRVGEYPIPINTLNSGESYKFTILVNGASRYTVKTCYCN